jgi:hypothetical protein
MPTAPTIGIAFRFEPNKGDWLRLGVESIEWDVIRGVFLCAAYDYLLTQFTSFSTLASGANYFAAIGLTVNRVSLDESDAERLRRQSEKAKAQAAIHAAEAEIQAVIDSEHQGKFEETIQAFSDLDSHEKDVLRRLDTDSRRRIATDSRD